MQVIWMPAFTVSHNCFHCTGHCVPKVTHYQIVKSQREILFHSFVTLDSSWKLKKKVQNCYRVSSISQFQYHRIVMSSQILSEKWFWVNGGLWNPSSLVHISLSFFSRFTKLILTFCLLCLSLISYHHDFQMNGFKRLEIVVYQLRQLLGSTVLQRKWNFFFLPLDGQLLIYSRRAKDWPMAVRTEKQLWLRWNRSRHYITLSCT